MNFIAPLGVLVLVLSFCGITDKIKQQIGEAGDGVESTTKQDSGDEGSSGAETPELTSAQQEIMDAADTVEWPEQGMSWKLPDGWNKMDVKKEMFNYGSPATGFLIGSISVMSDDFPSDVSLKATYDSALQQLKNGKYENVRYLEIDGVKGVEWVEAMPEETDSPRRHQWLAFRNYQGQNQQLNIMLTTNGDKFGDKKDTFAAIMYSMKIDK